MSEWIVGFIQLHGLPAVALLMFLENVFPPIPSELIMPFAGFAAARGNMNIVLVALSGAGGSVAGVVFWYWVGRRFGVERLKRWAADHGTYLAVSSDDVAAYSCLLQIQFQISGRQRELLVEALVHRATR